MSRKQWGSAVIASARARARLWPHGDAAGNRPVLLARARRPTTKPILRVVIADDCRDSADSLSALMRFWGHDVRVAYSGAAVLEITLTYQPDVLLLDIGMPQMNGLELARQLRRLPAIENSLLVAITGYADEAHRLLGADAGFDLYLIKPVQPPILEELMQLEKKSRHDESRFSTPPARPLGILVVDDEDALRRVVGTALRQRGFTVWLAADAHEALELYGLNRDAIDLVLLDVRMPAPDGPQTLTMLRQLNPQICCCFMSGEFGRYSEEALYELGAAAVLAKPFSMTAAAQRLWELAGRGGMDPLAGDERNTQELSRHHGLQHEPA
jgi:CheY-like chemotaxis protein